MQLSKPILWWRVTTIVWRVAVIWLLLVVEHVAGVPFIGFLCFYRWFGQSSSSSTSWWWAFLSLATALLYQVSWGGTMVVLLGWWCLVSWSVGKYFAGKWWIWLTTFVISLTYVLLYQPSSWWLAIGWYLVGTVGWWFVTKKAIYGSE